MMQQHVQGPLSSSHGPNTGAPSLKGHSDPPCDCHTEGRWDSDPSDPWDSDPWDSDPSDPSDPWDPSGSSDPSDPWDPSGPSDFSRSLPAEMSEQIFLQLDPRSLCRAAQTCRRWHRLIHGSEAVWRGQCLLLRAHCHRELERDRGRGFSWKVTLVRNYTRSRLKRDWLRGRFSGVRSADELRGVRMEPLDAESWGEILQAELER